MVETKTQLLTFLWGARPLLNGMRRVQTHPHLLASLLAGE